MSRWEEMEQWLYQTGVSDFTSSELAASAGISPAEASGWIRAYQAAQAAPGMRTQYVIRREGRTSATVWKVGVTPEAVRGFSKQFANDVQRRVDSTVVPIIDAIVERNPKARKQAISTGVQIGRLVEQLAHL